MLRRRFDRPGHRDAENLDIVAVVDPGQRFLERQRQMQIAAAAAAHRAIEVKLVGHER
jgi:hypothetical protein